MAKVKSTVTRKPRKIRTAPRRAPVTRKRVAKVAKEVVVIPPRSRAGLSDNEKTVLTFLLLGDMTEQELAYAMVTAPFHHKIVECREWNHFCSYTRTCFNCTRDKLKQTLLPTLTKAGWIRFDKAKYSLVG